MIIGGSMKILGNKNNCSAVIYICFCGLLRLKGVNSVKHTFYVLCSFRFPFVFQVKEKESTSCHGNGRPPPCSCRGRSSERAASLCPGRRLVSRPDLLPGRDRVSAGKSRRSPSLRPHAPSPVAHLASAEGTPRSNWEYWEMRDLQLV